MNARSIVTVVALFSSVAVFVVAMLTSAASLYEIAVAENLAAPWGLPVVLDLLATASAAVAWVTRSWGARLAAAAAFAVSLSLQISHVWAQGPTAWITHSAAPVSAVVMFEVALILAGRSHASTTAKPRPKPAPKPATKPAPPVGVPPPGRAPEVPATPLRPATPETRPLRPAARGKSMDGLVAEAVALADRLGVTVTDVSQRTLRSELGIGDARARELSKLLKDGPEDTDLVVGYLHALSSNGARP